MSGGVREWVSGGVREWVSGGVRECEWSEWANAFEIKYFQRYL